ncbi:AsmA-like C-terminal region-containing protein [Variovorax dokdonensis]|uniref:AsmA-like C-terminal region-containing protein n=1 Tax=Variovorax dokdonensis TaxID=344883 RepID=A0ABT7NFM0_9BURK|nr:AsmA-like C-terminal region-containing protein [Variovorax dokdonensis]MDM0046717.1 AsmA-like C-terminal region-containing protein [Variovorax dokdonensis]
MSRLRVVWLGVAGCAVAALAVLAVAAWAWLPSQQEAATRLAQAFEERTGTEVTLGSVRWSLWPSPSLVVENVVTRQDNPIVADRVRLVGTWSSLLHRQPRVKEARFDGLLLSRDSLREFMAARTSSDAAPDPPLETARMLRDVRLVFDDLTWVDRRHVELTYSGDIDFGADGMPSRADIRRPDAKTQARMRLARQGDDTRWKVDIDVAGGTWNGEATLKDEPGAKGGRLQLQAALTPRDIEVEALAATFKRRSVVAGRASGTTKVDARGERWADLIRSLRTQTRFAAAPARITRFDLSRAITTVGAETAGATPLDRFSGIVETRNTGRGIEFRYSELKAQSGALSASGQIRLFNGKLEGDMAVDLVDGVVGVPVVISGTVQEPVLSPSAGAVAGAAVGSAVLPGVGTALGARLGHSIERLLDGESPGAQTQAPAKAGAAKATAKPATGEPPNPERGPSR